jgi:gamma-glutamylputrescine oxidase
VVGLARAAATAGARLHENTRARGIASDGGKVTVKTDAGDIVPAGR